MSQRRSLEIRVGAFIVSGLALLVFFIFAIGDFTTAFQPSYQLNVLFDSANGITNGSPVQYAGVEVGRVTGVRIVHLPEHQSPQVEVHVRLPSDVRVREDDIAEISTLGLLGEMFLEITPGPGSGQILQAGARLPGKPPVSTNELIERSSEVLDELKQALQGLNSLVGDHEAKIYLKETLQEARDATRQWKLLGERMNMLMLHIESGEGSLGKMLYDDEIYRRSLELIDDLKANPWKLLIKPRKKKQ